MVYLLYVLCEENYARTIVEEIHYTGQPIYVCVC